MLSYSYACQACKHEFDALVESSVERPDCPICGSKKTLLDPICRPVIRPSNWRRHRVLDMSSGGCPCGCGKKRA
jgi:putative FmdB family regulatory protein